MSRMRSEKISSHYKKKIVTVQRTNRQSDDDVTIECSGAHYVVHFPACIAKRRREKPKAGVAIMVPRTDRNLVKEIGIPNNTELKGRVGYLRLINKKNTGHHDHHRLLAR